MFIGALFGVILAFVLGLPIIEGALVVLMSSICALAPDIDHDSSKIRKIANVTVPIAALGFSFAATCTAGYMCNLEDLRAVVLLGLAITGVYMIVITFCKPKHRGITHTIFSALIFGLIIYVFSDLNFALAGFTGYASHLVADKHIRII